MRFWLTQFLTLILFLVAIAIVLITRWVSERLGSDYDLTIGLALMAIWLASREAALRMYPPEEPS